jgi:hypothetical protein
MTQGPTQATIFSYRVGFGDAFLVRFDYPDRPRHLLIDFGTTGQPKDTENTLMANVARDIAEKCGGRLEAVVATHRHADHISGFATKADGSGSGDIIRALDIDTVIQPWTEAPDAATDSLGPEVSSPNRAMTQRLQSLNAMNALSEHVVRMIDAKQLKDLPKSLHDQLEFIGRDNVKNLSAVENLMTMARRNVYAWHGSDAGLDDLLPGVKTHVLGPPTLRQTETIRKQRSRDPDQYWHFALKGVAEADEARMSDDAPSLFSGHPTFRGSKLPLEVRGIATRLTQARAEQYLSMVTALDQQMNNTSLILLFETGGKKLLFPGDAQIENWSYALSKPEIVELLADVDLYKVGHHGSLNATPKSVWTAFRKRSQKEGPERLTTLLSTMPGKHGHEEQRTEVPRRTLLKALKEESNLHSTHELPAGTLYQEVTIAF